MKKERKTISNMKVEYIKTKERFQRSLQREERGITLVALVITIIILIILATVTINAVFGENGLIKQAEYARDLSANSTEAEYEGMNSIFDEFVNMMEEDSQIPVEPTTPSTIEDAKNNGGAFDDTTTIKDDLNNDVTIPGGFHVAEDSGTKVEEGIVIEDDAGNQFVWIPVGEYNVSTSINASGKLTNNLNRRSFASSGATEVSGDDGIQEITGEYYYGEGNENSVAKNQIEAFKTSATTNKGFYIGRYEAGTEIGRTSAGDTLTKPLVQANKNAYVYITRDQAKTQAEAMYSGNSYVTSELASSYAWDTALNFMCQNSDEGYLLSTTTDSTYGNMGTGNRELTGAYLADSYCNINDFVGNCREWITEYCSNGPGVNRGGNYFNGAYFAARRGYGNISYSNPDWSFRIQLYIS